MFLVFAFLSLAFSPSVRALPCEAAVRLVDGDTVYIQGLALRIESESESSIRFSATHPLKPNFADNLCQSCGFGAKGVSVALTNGRMGLYGILSADGKLVRISELPSSASVVESLTCSKLHEHD